MSQQTADLVHASSGGAHEAPTATPRARDRDGRQLVLSLIDKLAATAFTGLDTPDIVELTRSTAAALADENLEAARGSRRRVVARLIAIEKTTLAAVIAMLGESVRSDLSDDHTVRVARLLDSLANSSCRRLTMLLGAAEQRGPAIAIDNALVKVEAAE